jgi:hypothetical protein
MNTTMQTTRACDDCGQVTDYEPLMWNAWDMLRDLPHLCEACADARVKADEAAAAARAREKREAAWVATVPKKYR